MIKTIIFDLGGVCFSNGTRRFAENIAISFNKDKDKLLQLMNGEISSFYRMGLITTECFWTAVSHEVQLSMSPKELDNLWNECYEPISQTVELLRDLKKLDIELLFLSDITKPRFEYLSQNYQVLNLFDNGVCSFAIKDRKPSVFCYKAVLSLTQSEPKECIYIDDKPIFLEPAKNLGMHTIHFQSCEYVTDILNRQYKINLEKWT